MGRVLRKVAVAVTLLGCLSGALACSSAASTAPDPAAIARGEMLFHDRTLSGFGGNGRACADCHVDNDGFQLTPDRAEARFQQMLTSGVDDPLFRPIDADDFDASGDAATDYSSLRQNGLIRIRLPLPANIKLVDPASCETGGTAAPCATAETYALSAATTTDVWRAVPSVVNVALTGPESSGSTWPRGPNPRGGYQLDGRVDTLQHQARAAFLDHAEVTTVPSDAQLDDIVAYEDSLVAAPEPPLGALETQGKEVFNRACSQCHGGPGMSTPLTTASQQIIRFHDDFNDCPRLVDTVTPARWSFAACGPGLAKHEQTYEITFADGFKMRRTTNDPGRALLSGYVASAPPASDGSCAHPPCGEAFKDDWQKLEIAPLHGISKTAPYFHNNSAATLEEVVVHYEDVFKQIEALFPDTAPNIPPVLTTDGSHEDRPNLPAERAALVAYLMTL